MAVRFCRMLDMHKDMQGVCEERNPSQQCMLQLLIHD